eukprot:2687823-Karenia_brevis.AAC.1
MPEQHPSFIHLKLAGLIVDSVRDGRNDSQEHQASCDKAWVHEIFEDGQVVIYSDGACTHNQDHRFRRAGCGGFWPKDHALNFGEPLHGWC